MKDYRLNRALSGIDDRWLDMADPFEQEVQSMNIRHRAPRRALRTILIAAALTALFTLTAYAVSSIHAARQSELRQELNITGSKTESYVEYPVPTEQAPGVVLLSAISDGQEQKVYVNVSPVTPEELERIAAGELSLHWEIEGTGFSGFAAPQLPPDLTLSGREEIAAAVKEHAYDEQTGTLTAECWIWMEKLREIMAEQGADSVGLSLYMGPRDGEQRCFGTAPFTPTEEERRVFDFGHAVYHDPDSGLDIELVGLELTPISAVWKVHYEGDAAFHTPGEDWDAYAPWSTLEDKVCIEAQLIFSDGSRFSTGGALTCPYENGTVNQYCGWAKAIDVHDVQRIVLEDLTLWEAE